MVRDGSRSRTPEPSERISRAIAGFGRYPERRPKGLQVDSSGAFRLEVLMRAWGKDQGLSEREVLHAVRKHMFHESEDGSRSAGPLRFAIGCDLYGQITIRVLPKRKGSEALAAPCAVPLRTQMARGREPVRQVRAMRGSVLQDFEAKSRREAAMTVTVPDEAEPEAEMMGPGGENPKLSMSLDDCIRTDWGGQRPARDASGRRPQPKRTPQEKAATALAEQEAVRAAAAARAEQAARVRHKLAQMGLTPESKHLRLAPGMAAREGRYASYMENGGAKHRHGDPGSRVQRWIAWMLRYGHSTQEHKMAVEDGWASLEVLAVEMRKEAKFRELGEFDEVKLRDFLIKTDEAGRFEFNDDGCVRKVPKAERKPREAAVGIAPDAPPDGAAELPEQRQAPGRLRGRSPGRRSLSSSSSLSSGAPRCRSPISRSPSPLAADDTMETMDSMANGGDDAILAEVCKKSLNVSGEVVTLSAAEAEALETAPAAAAGGAVDPVTQVDGKVPPAPPPGDCWTKYQDVDACWWHYDGPLGQWWCNSNVEEIKPYVDDTLAGD